MNSTPAANAHHIERDALTFADVLDRITGDPDLPATRRRDLASAIRCLAHLTGRPAATIAAHPRPLADLLTTLDSRGSGLTAKRRRNIASDLLAAMRAANLVPTISRSPLIGPWARLYDALPERRLQHGLTRFLNFVQRHDIVPTAVDATQVDAFTVELEATTLLSDKQVRDRARQVRRCWGAAREALPASALAVLPGDQPPRAQVAPSLTTYPQSLQTEISTHLAWLGGETFLTDPPPRVLKPSTRHLRGEHLRLAAGALVSAGRPPATIGSLDDLIAPTSVKTIAEVYFRRNGKRVTPFMRDLVSTLISVARHWGRADTATLEALKESRRRLGATPATLTDKNQQLIARFDDPTMVARLFTLPTRLLREGDTIGGSRGAMRAQIALAIALLTYVPVRIGNLASLRVGHSLIACGDGWRLHVHADAVKNAERLTFQVPPPVAQVLRRYMNQHRQHLCAPQHGFLFPGRDERAKLATTLSGQIEHAIARHLGFHMTAHQFRHLAAKLYLDRHPGDYVTVQRLLGHKNLKTTMNFYAGMRTEHAGLAYADMLEAARQSPMPRRRRAGR